LIFQTHATSKASGPPTRIMATAPMQGAVDTAQMVSELYIDSKNNKPKPDFSF